MIKRNYLLLIFISSLAFSLIVAFLQPVPGYMDAEYYYANGMQIASGNGFYENFLWNYLDDPVSIKHPAFTYWMPFASIIAAAGMWISGSINFFSARLIFIFLSASLPILSILFNFYLIGSKRGLWLSGMLALFPGFYLIYITNTDTFTICIILGSLFTLAGFYDRSKFLNQTHELRFFILGLLAGGMHLARADGFLWFIAALGLGLWFGIKEFLVIRRVTRPLLIRTVILMILVFSGYLIIMFPWIWRNLGVYGSLFPHGGGHTLWLVDYDQLFSFPASTISIQEWISSGWKQHLHTWLDSLSINLQTLVAVQGEIFLFPFIIWGGWRLRDRAFVKFNVLMWLVTLGIMTVIFPFSGQRGGFLHSGAIFQIFFWSLVPSGLEGFVEFGVRSRGWKSNEAWQFFMISLVVGSMLLSVGLFSTRVIGKDFKQPIWKNGWDVNQQIGDEISKFGADRSTVVMINNPPGYYAASQRPSIVIPDGDETVILLAAKQYGAKLLVLEKNHPQKLNSLYESPGDRKGLIYLGKIGDARVYRIEITP